VGQTENTGLMPLLFLVGLIAVGTWIVTLTHIALLIRSRAKRNRQRRIDQRDDEVAGEPEEGNRGQHEADGLSSNFAALIRAIENQGRRNRDEERREDNGNAFREGLAILLLSATLLAISWQVIEMIKVYGPIERQAAYAKISADAAVAQSKSSETALIQAQRAWVGPLKASIISEPVINKPVEITVSYYNTGREPAVAFISFVDAFLAPVPDGEYAVATIQTHLAACRDRNKWAGGSVVYPTAGGFGGGYSFSGKTPENFVGPNVTNGSETIMVYGCFNYRTFELPRHSFFCYYYRQGFTKIDNLNICPTGHEAN
jgi:hypothetical protein